MTSCSVRVHRSVTSVRSSHLAGSTDKRLAVANISAARHFVEISFTAQTYRLNQPYHLVIVYKKQPDTPHTECYNIILEPSMHWLVNCPNPFVLVTPIATSIPIAAKDRIIELSIRTEFLLTTIHTDHLNEHTNIVHVNTGFIIDQHAIARNVHFEQSKYHTTVYMYIGTFSKESVIDHEILEVRKRKKHDSPNCETWCSSTYLLAAGVP